ncbi:3'-5' exonuclease [Motilimonas pumila]|uniref:3'-5' exonuclease n=1 Tax=Motilimonas pumila TaxID=2303987 RepID=A0A418YF33_9GAMM|nr:3'-5' exonuclease [Motilimonas pumila]RJG47865.1 3'-5' exonuclease [Motilimonas pumila]
MLFQFLKHCKMPFEKKKAARAGYQWLFEPYHGDEIVSLDFETTGLNPKIDDIISIGAVIVKGQRVLTSKQLNLAIKPKQVIPQDAIKIHRIRNQDAANGITLEQALPELLQFIGNRPILGYFVKFDLALLNRCCQQRYDFQLPNDAIELCNIYYKKVNAYYPDAWVDHKFETLATTLDIPVLGRHSAVGDAITTALMYLKLTYGNRPKLM